LLGAGDYSVANYGLLDGPDGGFISLGWANPVCVTFLGASAFTTSYLEFPPPIFKFEFKQYIFI